MSELAKQKVTNVERGVRHVQLRDARQQLFLDHRRGVIERILGWFGCVRAAPKFKGKQMTLDAPPEPCDVEWENYDIRGLARTSRNVKTLFGMLAALGVGIALQVSFEQLREDVRVEQYDEEVKAAAYDVESTLALKDEIYMRFPTMLSSFVIVAVNVFLTTVAKKLSRYQRFYTQSEFEAALMLKLTVVHVINSIIVPAAELPPCERTENTAGECLWYAPAVSSRVPSISSCSTPSSPTSSRSRGHRRTVQAPGSVALRADAGDDGPRDGTPRIHPRREVRLCVQRWRWQWFTAPCSP